jgi:hypothetical protein
VSRARAVEAPREVRISFGEGGEEMLDGAEMVL